jgi:hypothetical protein
MRGRCGCRAWCADCLDVLDIDGEGAASWICRRRWLARPARDQLVCGSTRLPDQGPGLPGQTPLLATGLTVQSRKEKGFPAEF